jgi:hypothetical protein
VSIASQLAYPFAWQSTSQLTFAFAVQLPLQLAWHLAWHVAEGGVAEQWPWQSAPHLPLQVASHCDWLPFDWHAPWQLPEQSASHEPSQSKVPGWALQLASQFPLQLAVQFTSADAVHCPEHITSSCAAHAASKCTGVQSAEQPPDVSSLQLAFACTSMLPHEERRSARATPGAETTSAPVARNTPANTRECFMEQRLARTGAPCTDRACSMRPSIRRWT